VFIPSSIHFAGTWTSTTAQLISSSRDSSDRPEPPTTSSPLHPVSRNGSREARTKREARVKIPSSKLQISNKHQGANPKELETPSSNVAAFAARASGGFAMQEPAWGTPCAPKASRGRCAAQKKTRAGARGPQRKIPRWGTPRCPRDARAGRPRHEGGSVSVI